MKRLLAFIAVACPLVAQVSNPSIISVTSAPSGACSAGLPNRQVISTGALYSCQGGTWGEIGGGGGGGFTGTATSPHLTMGVGADVLGDSPATFASGLFTFPNNTLTGTNPSAFTNWTELSWTSFLELAGRSDNGIDAYPVGSGVFYQLNDQNAVGIDTDPAASGTVSSLDWIRNNSFSGMAEAIGAMGQVFVHGNGTTAEGHAYGSSGQVFVDNDVNEATGQYALGYFNLSGSDTPSVTVMNGLRTELAVGGSGALGTYTGVYIGSDGGFSGSGATVQHSRGLYIEGMQQGAVDNYQIYSNGTAPSYFHGGMQFDNLTGHGTAGVVAIDLTGNLSNSASPTISAANMTSFPASLARAAISNAVTSATGGSGTGTVACATASCTNLRGSYTVAGGTFATGTLLTLVWPTTTTAYVCSGSVLNNATGASIGYHSVATATGITFSSLTAATGLSIDIDYACQP